jgi:glutamyl-tRNA reductase
MKDADVIICAMGGRNHILTGDMVRVALKSRKNKPQFIVDTSVPGDVEPSVSRINDSFVYDLSDLERLTREGINNREKAANEAWQIINQEVELYLNDQAERKVVPTLAMLRQHFDQVRSDVLLENKNNAERATQLLVNRLLDSPTRVLRANASKKNSRSLELEKSTKSLFGLEVPNSYREESIKVTK